VYRDAAATLPGTVNSSEYTTISGARDPVAIVSARWRARSADSDPSVAQITLLNTVPPRERFARFDAAARLMTIPR
jgi:hypothetical protein